jgi:hypothetical protein
MHRTHLRVAPRRSGEFINRVYERRHAATPISNECSAREANNPSQ